MAEEESGQDRSEEATPERRDEFRERGDIAISKEITSVAILAATIAYLGFDFIRLREQLKIFMVGQFHRLGTAPMGIDAVHNYATETWTKALKLFIPIGAVAATAAILSTFGQTRLNFSWEKVKPNFQRLDPLSGLKRMVDFHAVIEVIKSLGKMIAVGLMAYLILMGEWKKVPSLMFFSVHDTWKYWGSITKSLVWSVVFLTFVIAAGDFFYHFLSFERKLKMTKQEVKEEYKKRETDPHVKNKMRRMQRELSAAKTIRATRTATVVITNPTHYAIAIRYIAGQRAPRVVAKGVDYMALRMREVAKESDVPIVENPPLARTLYKIMEVGHEVPENLWTAVSEVIRYVIKIKGWDFVRNRGANI